MSNTKDWGRKKVQEGWGGLKKKKTSYTETQTTPILSAGARGKNSDDRH